MNSQQVQEVTKGDQYYIGFDEQIRTHAKNSRDRDRAVDLLTILMTDADQPLTAGEVLARVRAWCDKRTKEGKSFYFYWGESSFIEYLDELANIFSLRFLDRTEHNNVVKYQANKWGLLMLSKHRKWLEEYLGESIDQIKQSFPPLPTK